MKFKVEHVFKSIELDAYEELYFDEAFNIALCDAVKLGRELIERSVNDGQLSRTVKVIPNRQIPKPAADILGAAEIAYTEHLDYKMGSYHGTWRTKTAVMPDKVESHGTFTFERHPEGVLRRVEGIVKVKLFGVGGVAERFIAADIEKSYDQAANFTRQWIAEH